jgi:hypothetical protein
LPPAVATNSASNAIAASVAEANSFTMAQARMCVRDRGYTQASALAKDDGFIWRRHAVKNGNAVHVALDCQVNITAN